MTTSSPSSSHTPTERSSADPVADPATGSTKASGGPAFEGQGDAEIRRRALRGSVWTLGGHAVNNAIRLGANLVLTRLLFPEFFGVMALVNIFLQGLHMFSDVGIGTSIIQHARGEEPTFVNTAWTVQVVRGVYLFLVSCVLGWPLAWFYEMPDLAWMVPVAGSTALIDGFTSTSLFTQNRTLTLGRLTVVEVAANAASALANVTVAYTTRSIWALLVGGIAGGIVRLVLSHAYLPGIRNRFAWEREARKDLLGFGRWVFVSTAVTFVAMQVDRLVLGKLVSEEELGVYSIALMLASLPREVVSQLAQRVYYPVVAREIRVDARSAKVRDLRAKLVALLIVPVACTMGVSTPLINLLYDDRYLLAGPLMGWLTLGTWLSILESTYGAIALARGEPRWITFGTMGKTVVFAALVVPVFSHWGIEGVAVLVSLSTLALVGTTAWAARRGGLASLGADVVGTVAMLACASAARALHGAVAELTGSSLVGIIALAVIAVGLPGTLLLTRRVRLL